MSGSEKLLDGLLEQAASKYLTAAGEITFPSLVPVFKKRPSQFAASPELAAAASEHCTKCGACCAYFATPLHGLNLIDGQFNGVPRKMIQIGPRRPLSWTSYNKYLRVVRDSHLPGKYRCAALQGKAGSAVGCSIYDRRPRMCREFEPGSQYCMQIQKALGIETQSLESLHFGAS